jgi:hypothetical protein
VDAQGQVLTVSEQQHSDLFWACRGAGGGNFGVVVSYTFKIFKAGHVTLIQLRWQPDSRVDVLNVWKDWLPGADKRISCFAGFTGDYAYLNSFFYGSEKEARRILKDFLAIPELSSDSVIKRVPFIEAVRAMGAEYGPPMKFKSTGRFVFQRITGETARELVKWVDRSPDKSKCRISMYSMGGVISDTGADGSAFYYRNAQYIMGISAAWEKDRDAASFKRWIGKGFQFMRSFSKGTYANFPYSELNDYEREYYGTHTFRLRKIKRKYDPENFFHFQQSIR